MNFPEIENTVKHLQKISTCMNCKSKYLKENIHIIATTNQEGLFEMKCSKCKDSTIVTILLTPEIQVKEKNLGRTHRKVSENDILDIKNSLNNFDGNFEKIFSKDNK